MAAYGAGIASGLDQYKPSQYLQTSDISDYKIDSQQFKQETAAMEQRMQMKTSMEEQKGGIQLMDPRNGNLGTFPTTNNNNLTTDDNLNGSALEHSKNSIESTSAIDRIAALRQQFMSFRKQSEVMNI